MTTVETYQGFHIGSETGLTEGQMRFLVSVFRQPPAAAASGPALGGRKEVLRTELEGIGPVVVKQYFRGGLVQNLLKQTYLNTGITRCRAEYELLLSLHKSGVQVPEPVAFATSGGLFYRAWLVTRAIGNAITLAELAQAEPDQAAAALLQAGQQAAALVGNHVHHVDLHPGNVLVDPRGRVYLVDFDKARITPENSAGLRQKYISRWRRSVAKHRLPPFLGDLQI